MKTNVLWFSGLVNSFGNWKEQPSFSGTRSRFPLDDEPRSSCGKMALKASALALAWMAAFACAEIATAMPGESHWFVFEVISLPEGFQSFFSPGILSLLRELRERVEFDEAEPVDSVNFGRGGACNWRTTTDSVVPVVECCRHNGGKHRADKKTAQKSQYISTTGHPLPEDVSSSRFRKAIEHHWTPQIDHLRNDVMQHTRTPFPAARHSWIKLYVKIQVGRAAK